ncbi:MAG: GNAT family N-acetyltransferase [Deferrisomatales bacterium]
MHRPFASPQEALGRFRHKVVTAEEAVCDIRSGDHVFVGTACATPRRLVAALEARTPAPADVELFHFLTDGALAPGGEEPRAHLRHRTFFVGADMRAAVARGAAEYVPISVAQIPALIENGRIPCHAAFVQVSPPDPFGYVSLGVSVDIASAALAKAKRIIAEVNPNMPWTFGDTALHLDRIDKLVLVDAPVIEYTHQPADAVARQIARYIAGIIDDGSTLQVGLGRIPNETLKYLADRRDLGVHSDVITDPILDLVERRVITGEKKTVHRGKIVASYCMGTRRLYDAIDRNPLFAFHPIEHVCAPAVVAANRQMVSITQAFAVDLTGQVCADQFQGEFYGGVSTQVDFLRGAAQSAGGKPIICLASTTDDGKTSRIRPLLQTGEGVAVARSDVHYVVTEWGIAYLFGKSISERALSLVEVAHPDFREWLLDEAKRLAYLSPAQTMESRRSYPVEEERSVALKNGQAVLIRPSRASDAAGMKELFYTLSKEDVYTRFFRQLRALSFEEVQRLCNVNHETAVAFVAVSGGRENERVVGSSCYFVNHTRNMAEVAYMIRPEWQGTGLGKALQGRMADHAKARGLAGFTAEILASNSKMLALARGAAEAVSVHRDGETCEVEMRF